MSSSIFDSFDDKEYIQQYKIIQVLVLPNKTF